MTSTGEVQIPSVREVQIARLKYDFPGWDIDGSDLFDLASRRLSDGYPCTSRDYGGLRSQMMHADVMAIRDEVKGKST